MKVALPCIHFSVKERGIIERHGFLTFPTFLDNHYIKQLKARPAWLVKQIEKYGERVKFAIAPDYLYDSALALLKRYPWVNWIFPLHRKDELVVASKFDWVGFPHRFAFRDYSLRWFLSHTRDKRRWYLGFWDESSPFRLLRFDGFDTTIPETYSGKYGKIWYSWGISDKPAVKLRTVEMFETNVRNFKRAVEKLLAQSVLA